MSKTKRTLAVVGVAALAVTGGTAAVSATSSPSSADDCMEQHANGATPHQNDHAFINQWLGANDAANFGEMEAPFDQVEEYATVSGSTMVLCAPGAADDELGNIGANLIHDIGSGGYGPRTVTVANSDDETATVTWDEVFPDRS